ncbi:MAG: RsfS/YbeB/iojap family protein [Leptospirales bacterium]
MEYPSEISHQSASSEGGSSEKEPRETRLEQTDARVHETDEQTRERAERMARFLQDKKVRSVWLMEPGATCAYADCLIFGDIEHDRHRDAVLEQLDAQFSRPGEPFRSEKGSHWTLVDFDSVVVHLFQHGGRALYRLEDLFPKAPLFILREDGQFESVAPEHRPMPTPLEHSDHEDGLILPSPLRSPGI